MYILALNYIDIKDQDKKVTPLVDHGTIYKKKGWY